MSESTQTSLIHDANAAIIERGEMDQLGEFFDENYLVHLTERDMVGGHGLVKRIISAIRRSFPDVQVAVEVLVERGDRIAWQRTLTGTHRRAFRGFPGTGKTVTWRDMVTSRIENGRIAEEWVVSDLAGQLLRSRK